MPTPEDGPCFGVSFTLPDDVSPNTNAYTTLNILTAAPHHFINRSSSKLSPAVNKPSTLNQKIKFSP